MVLEKKVDWSGKN